MTPLYRNCLPASRAPPSGSSTLLPWHPFWLPVFDGWPDAPCAYLQFTSG